MAMTLHVDSDTPGSGKTATKVIGHFEMAQEDIYYLRVGDKIHVDRTSEIGEDGRIKKTK